MKKLFFLLLVFCINNAFTEKSGSVHLKGRLDITGPVVVMAYNGASSMLGDSRDIKIKIDEHGFFDTIIPLKKAEYYSIRRNTIYLSPGDDMEIYINETNTEAKFKGKGDVVNEYMKYRLFPKGGSYLEAGKNIKKDFPSTKAFIDSAATVRLSQLKNLTGVSQEFKQLEEARIEADIINSYLAFASYSGMVNKVEIKKSAFITEIEPSVKPLIKKITDEKYLDVAVVRDVLSMSGDPSSQILFEGINLPERTKELYEAADYVSKLRREATPKVIDDSKQYARNMRNNDFKTELINKVVQASKLLPGEPAIDIEIEDRAGNIHKLSELKGKVLYVDFWATWCGPCIAESPIFNELNKKYTGKDIFFIQISTDNNRKAWLDFTDKKSSSLPQFISKDIRLKDEWAIFYIPRFILIDKDFRIINSYAELPSDKNIEVILNNIVK
jgi:thiol-disulfide isomerase/thioredoxin